MMCPQCGGDNVRIAPYDFGRCSETGYHDAGERFHCHDCGAEGDVDEIERATTQGERHDVRASHATGENHALGASHPS